MEDTPIPSPLSLLPAQFSTSCGATSRSLSLCPPLPILTQVPLSLSLLSILFIFIFCHSHSDLPAPQLPFLSLPPSLIPHFLFLPSSSPLLLYLLSPSLSNLSLLFSSSIFLTSRHPSLQHPYLLEYTPFSLSPSVLHPPPCSFLSPILACSLLLPLFLSSLLQPSFPSPPSFSPPLPLSLLPSLFSLPLLPPLPILCLWLLPACPAYPGPLREAWVSGLAPPAHHPRSLGGRLGLRPHRAPPTCLADWGSSPLSFLALSFSLMSFFCKKFPFGMMMRHNIFIQTAIE